MESVNLFKLILKLTFFGACVSQITPTPGPPSSTQAPWLNAALQTQAPTPRPSQRTNSPVTVTTSHANIHERFTKELTVTCAFSNALNTEFSAVISLILAKTDTPSDSSFNEISTITQLTPTTVEVKDDLGATVSGELVVGGDTYITYKWLYPETRVEGQYQCTAHGMDRLGHPVAASAHTVITERDVGLQMVLEKMKTLEITQDALRVQLNNAQTKLGNLQDQLNSSARAIFANGTSFRGHDYYISKRMLNDVAMFEGICQLYGGYLVDIADQQEYDVVVDLEKNTLPVNAHVMLGMTDEGHEGNWTSIHSDQPVSFLKWYSGEPNSGASNNCAYLDYSNFKMYDDTCASSGIYRFVCEMP